MGFACPAIAQSRPVPVRSAVVEQMEDEPPLVHQQSSPIEANQVGNTNQSSAGRVGQRLTRESTATRVGIKPMARISSRIQNRVQNRVRNRIDRNYNIQANGTDPFAVAEDQARTAGRPR